MKIANKKYVWPALVCTAAVTGLFYYYFFSSFSNREDTQYVCIDHDDTADSVCAKLRPMATAQGMAGLGTLMRHSSYADHVRTGRYAVLPGMGAFSLFRKLKNGIQTPLNLTIPSVRTLDRLAANVGSKLMMDSTELASALTDPALCKRYGLDTLTMVCLFIPNTYDIYWNISVEKFLDRMHKEQQRFWNEERTAKARQAGLTPTQVCTLASIVDEETANDDEKPMIAGLYLNRLRKDMLLQADPTVKFAMQKFGLKRIYNSMLSIDSPYNTYRYKGLPPGPIRIPSVAGVEAVLNATPHDYLYMCAKEDFSGTHNFARTYEEHQQNARRYTEALNKRGIK